MRVPRLLAGAAAVVVSAGALAACGSDEDGRSVPSGSAGPVLAGTAERLTGGAIDLADYRGDVVLVVNTASQCGYTPQFAELQELHEAKAAEGLTILGFPSDSFAQELDDAEAISEVCHRNFGVEFPMFARTAVTGEDAHPLFVRLAAATGEEPRWNFNKYLVDRDGTVVGRFDSGVSPADPAFRERIDGLL